MAIVREKSQETELLSEMRDRGWGLKIVSKRWHFEKGRKKLGHRVFKMERRTQVKLFRTSENMLCDLRLVAGRKWLTFWMGLKGKWAILCASLLSRADPRSQGTEIYQHKKGFDSLSKGSPVVRRAHEDDGAGAGLAEETKRNEYSERCVKQRENGLTKPWKENKSRKGWLTVSNATRDGRGNIPQLLAAETGK